MLTYFKRFETKFLSATFLRLHKCTTNLKMGPKHQAALKPTESAPPNENLDFWLEFRASARRKRVELDLDSRF